MTALTGTIGILIVAVLLSLGASTPGQRSAAIIRKMPRRKPGEKTADESIADALAAERAWRDAQKKV